MDNKPIYGGQAVVEGVMFGGKHCTVTTIKRKDGSYDSYTLPKTNRPLLMKLKKIPFLRGIVALLESSAVGSKHLSFSTDRYDIDPADDDKIQAEETSKLGMILGVAGIGILSFIMSKLIFTVVPIFLAVIFKDIASSDTAQVLLEGFFKLTLLLLYIYLVSLTPLVKRVFQYHGAEHKVINAFENNKELTVENVRNASRLHYRCGSSFILFTVFVGVFIYMFFVSSDVLYIRILNRIALIPVVLGVSFEVLQLTNKLRDVPVLRFLGYPGLWLQLLTTKEPNDDQIETAIISFNRMLETENRYKQGLMEEKIV